MLQIDISKCTGCRRCEAACSFFHSGKVSRNLSRIRVMSQYNLGVDYPVVCVQCQERYCMDCPVDALSIGEFGQIISSPTICTLCGSCVRNCPIGAIEINEMVVYVCDLCGGRPKCVDACTEGAITFVQTNRHISLKQVNGLNPSEKRFRYVNEVGKDLRKRWGEMHD